jgi:membrane protein involved in colicin uptake
MQDQPEFQAVGGQLHRVVYQEVDQNSVETEVQSQLEAAQTRLTEVRQAREQQEQVCVNAEAVAEEAANRLEELKTDEGVAEEAVQKSVASQESFARAKQLAAEQLEQENATEGDVDSDESDTSAEGVSVPINVAAAA